jgi:hypothetical protein
MVQFCQISKIWCAASMNITAVYLPAMMLTLPHMWCSLLGLCRPWMMLCSRKLNINKSLGPDNRHPMVLH